VAQGWVTRQAFMIKEI